MNETAAELSALPDYFGNILTAIIPLIGLVAFLMILSGGFKILTSAGDPKGIQSGSKTITMAVAGIALAILSWLILVLIKNLTGVNVTEFKFGF
jgi:TRAP-type C4-dicarboxylate transport system permease small subunit